MPIRYTFGLIYILLRNSTGTQSKCFSDGFKHALHSSYIIVRTKIFATILHYRSGWVNAWFGFVGDADVWIGLIIPIHNIVPGLILFDKIIFKYERFSL